jgi:anti-sigma regulatory factor (Ser/Thr protein kinase)
LQSGAHPEGNRLPQGGDPGTLQPAPAHATELKFTGETLMTMRGLIAEWALGLRLGTRRTEQLVLAVNELATNSVRYGGGAGGVRMWSEDGVLMVDVYDHGQIGEPLPGRIRPAADQDAGRGLWLVGQLCDVVQIRSTAAGSQVRLQMGVS